MDRRLFLKTVGFVTVGSLVPASAFGGPNWFTSAQTVSSVSTSSSRINVKDFGVIGDGRTDDGPAIQAAIDSLQVPGTNKYPGTVYFPVGNYKVVASLEVGDGLNLLGDSSEGFARGSEIQRWDDTTLPLMTQADPSLPLSFFTIKNMAFRNVVLAPRTKGNGGDCFRLYNVTNNSRFENIEIINFGGSGFNISRFTPARSDDNALFNCVFDQVFIIGCGEFGWEMTDQCHALWTHCDVNSTVEGFAKWSNPNNNKAGNQEFATFVACLWEGGAAGASPIAFICDDVQGMPLNLISMSFSGNSATACVQVNNTSIPHLNAIGCTYFGFTDFYDDNVNSENFDLDNGGSYMYAPVVRNLTVQKDVQLGGTSGPTIRSGTGTPEGAVTGRVGDLFLRTDGGASTTMYVKEWATGKTGWIGK